MNATVDVAADTRADLDRHRPTTRHLARHEHSVSYVPRVLTLKVARCTYRFLDVYHPCPSEKPAPAAVHALALKGKAGRLVIYAGAGISAAQPAGLPVGPELAEKVSTWLLGRVSGLGAYDNQNLLDVADAVEAQMGGRDLLQEALTEFAEFGEAEPNFAHRALALLLFEGVATVLTTNWDDCIERAAPVGTRLQVIVDNADFGRVRGPAVWKVHGCASRLGSLLVSTQDLATPPLWVNTALAPQLATSTIVFVGIGDIAEYVKVRLRQLLSLAGLAADLRVVSPDIVADWSTSQWSKIPEATLPEERRIGLTADAFMDDLLRAYVGETLAGLRADLLAEGLSGADVAGVTELLSAMGKTDAATLLEWLRLGRFRPPAGTPGDSAHLRTALLAAGTLATTTCILRPGGWLELNGERIMVLAGDGSIPGPRLADAARERVTKALSQGVVTLTDSARVVCAGFRGPLKTLAPSVAVDIVEPPSGTDIISGPSAFSVDLLSADELLRGAA
jgi:hypothetical protein